MSEWRPAGPILDELGVKMELDDNDRVTDVLVIAKTTDLATGEVGLVIASNELDWITQAGLHTAANYVFYENQPERG